MNERRWNVALAIAVLACAGAWGYRLLIGARPSEVNAGVYVTGETLPEFSGFRYGDQERTLVLFASSSCPACTDSMPLYRELVERMKTTSSPIPFVVISFDPPATLDAYLAEHRLAPKASASVSHERFKLRRTPTLMLVGRDGAVVNYWVGRASDERKREILSVIDLADGFP